MYFNACEKLGDYFIFADPIEANLDKRCSSRVIYTIVFEDPVEKDRFQRLLAACLFCNIGTCELLVPVSFAVSGMVSQYTHL